MYDRRGILLLLALLCGVVAILVVWFGLYAAEPVFERVPKAMIKMVDDGYCKTEDESGGFICVVGSTPTNDGTLRAVVGVLASEGSLILFGVGIKPTLMFPYVANCEVVTELDGTKISDSRECTVGEKGGVMGYAKAMTQGEPKLFGTSGKRFGSKWFCRGKCKAALRTE